MEIKTKINEPGGASGKELACQCRGCKKLGFNPWVEKIPWSRAWQPTPVFLPGEFHGQRSLAGYSPWSCKELDLTEQLALSVVRLSHHSPPHSLLPFLHSCMCMLSSFSCVRLFATQWTVPHQVPLSMEFSRQEYWSRLPFPLPGDLLNLEIKPMSPVSPALAGGFILSNQQY